MVNPLTSAASRPPTSPATRIGNGKGQWAPPRYCWNPPWLAGLAGPEGEHRRGVGAGGLEDDVGEVDQPGHAELQVQPPARDHVDAEVDQHRRDVELPGDAHAATSLRVATSDKMPCGRARSTITRITKATTFLYSGLKMAAATSVVIPMTRAPSMAP